MKNKIHLLIIDAQNDFCDLPDSYLPGDPDLMAAAAGGDDRIRPALPVAGAHQDMLRLADAMKRGLRGISDISLTLDSHHAVGIERPTFWRTASGGEVSPFTQITRAQVAAGEYLPRNPALLPRVLSYLEKLEAQGKYTHMVWTVHAVIGTWGHAVHQSVRKAYTEWEIAQQAVVNKVTKGSNPLTEHFSFLSAEVPDPSDPTTQLNTALIADIASADRIFVAGEAGSHCVKAGVLDIVNNFGTDSLSKLVLVQDAMSPVTGFETQYADFMRDMRARGLQTCTASEMAAELISNARR